MKAPRINFIGNKQKIVTWICDNIPRDVNSVFDAFSGGTAVSYELKKRNYTVITNDIMKINFLLAKALIQNKEVKFDVNDLDILFSGKPVKGFMYRNYSKVLFFPEECMELDRYKMNIDKFKNRYKRALAYTLLRRAMIRKMPYSRFTIPWQKILQLRDEEFSYKHYKRRRAYHNRCFKEHILGNVTSYNEAIFDNGRKNVSYNSNIFSLAPKVEADLIYMDPPYPGTMNNYFRFYSMLDEYICLRKLHPFKDNFVDRRTAVITFDRLFSALGKFKYWLLSFNNFSYPPRGEMEKLILRYAKRIKIITKNHTYQITGKQNKKKHIEYLFLVNTR